ncbi:putative oxidoreductase [Haloferula luteola]|uniref:Putative oxidoreductase n=1 Tax=Haloferula luteola TaxID=595692 RepID=A0A840V6R7_9BACT|nr:DoxX family protein [Haloferula luteola]MBB5351304.1 putative oxidoreductase [Haloferula luteola]
MKKFLFECGTRDAVASAGLLVLRVGFGLMMLIGHGWAKIEMFSKAKDTWTVPSLPLLSAMSPPVSMLATIVAEVGCSALLVLGLLTRPAAFVFGFTMLVAAFQVHSEAPFFMAGGAAKEPAFLYFLPSLVLVITGAGQFSVDALVYREKRRKFF